MQHEITSAPSSAEVARGLEAVQQELAQAKQAHDTAAYEAATNPGSDEAREKLAQARRRLGVLQSELEGLDAVGREAKRRERLAYLQGQIDKAEADRQAALSAVAAVAPAFDRVAAAIAQLGESWEALRQAELRSNQEEGRHSRMPHGHEFYPGSHNCKPLRDALLWLVFRDDELVLQRSDLVADSGGRPLPHRPAEVLGKWSQRARDQINRGIDQRIADLRVESDHVESGARA